MRRFCGISTVRMDPFSYSAGELHAEGVAVRSLAERFGTPLYVYSRTAMRERFRELAGAMAAFSPLICYSMKANSNVAVVSTLLDEGAGIDVVSGGEIFRALRAGASPSKIVFAGVGKTTDEINYALRQNILFFTVESEPELARISACARTLGTTAGVAIRVNPDVDPRTHKYVSTGKKENKFGLDLERAAAACAAAAKLPNIRLAGLHMHIGSQILLTEPFVEALRRITPLCRDMAARHESFRFLDMGGGIGIRYTPEQAPLSPAAFAAAVTPALRAIGLSVVMEPGRYLCGEAAVLVCRVQYVKENPFRKFIVVDAGMNDLIRPSLYDAYHDVSAVRQTASTARADLVGPICESGDFIALDRELPDAREGDLLAVRAAGAYGFSMASNYNSRPRPAEVMVEGQNSFLVRRRETWEDLVAGEVRPGD